MNVEELIYFIEEEFDEIQKGSLHPTSSIRNMDGWSSMHALILIALVDNHYDILLTGEELKHINTIQDLLETIVKRKS
ncbi:MAG: acyl carrier protein [Bacteroidetes bacterium]|nr:acyl carrier protein [Bacteroidota bacterium]